MLLDEYKNLNSELNTEEADSERMLQEDFDMIVEYLRENENLDALNEYSIYSEATYTTKTNSNVKRAFTKDHLFNHAKTMAALGYAKKDNAAEYAELQKIVKKRRMLIDKIVNKYRSKATKDARTLIKSATKVSSAVVKNKKDGVSGTKTPNNSLKPQVNGTDKK